MVEGKTGIANLRNFAEQHLQWVTLSVMLAKTSVRFPPAECLGMLFRNATASECITESMSKPVEGDFPASAYSSVFEQSVKPFLECVRVVLPCGVGQFGKQPSASRMLLDPHKIEEP